MNIHNVKHVAIYVRISDNKKSKSGKRVEDEETLRNHIEILSDFAELKGYTHETFKEVVSGGMSEIDERKHLKRLLDRIEEFDAILVVELSRISRNGKISELVLEYCQDYKKLIITPEAVYDLASNEIDVLMYRLGSAVSAHERSIIGKRIKNNKLQMARQGLNASGSVPLGYYRNPLTKKLEIDEDKANIIRYAFKLCSEGYGASKISQALNDLGYTTATGKAFTVRAIKDMFKIQTYKGWTVYNDYVTTKRNGKTVREINDTIIIEDTHPAIVPPELFDSVQKERSKRAERYSGGREKPMKLAPPPLIKDLLYCACCGRKVRISYNPQKKGYLIRSCTDLMQDGSKCPNSGFVAINVERAVIQQIVKYQKQLMEEIALLENDNMEEFKEEQETRKTALENQLTQLNEEMKGILRLELKYEMAGSTNPIQEEFIREEKQKNIDTKERLEKQLDELLKKMEQPTIQDEINSRKNTINIINELDGKTPEQVNTLLKQFIKKIYYTRIFPDEIKNLGNKNEKRKNYPATIEIEYF